MTKSKMWWHLYEPKKFEDMILNPEIRPYLQEAFEKVPNLMLIGPPGVGKGTYTRIFLKKTKLDNMWINASDERGIDTIRTKVKEFGRAMGFTGLKIIVMNEADALTPDAQKSLRDEIEFVQGVTRFIFQANYGHMIIDALKSRCQIVEMTNPPAKEIFNHCYKILKDEKITTGPKEKKVVIEIIKRCYPDIRSTINTLQQNVVQGKLRDKPVFSATEETFAEIFSAMKVKDVDAIRKLLRSNYISYSDLYSYLFEQAGEFASPGDAILAIGEALRWDSLVAIKEINFMYMIMDIIKRGII
jgi:replication factor C small subunit